MNYVVSKKHREREEFMSSTVHASFKKSGYVILSNLIFIKYDSIGLELVFMIICSFMKNFILLF